MNKNASVTMAAAMAVAGILTLAVLTMAIQHQAFAQVENQGSSYDNNKQCCEKQEPPKCCEPQQPPKCCDNDHNKCCDNNDNKQPEKKIDVTKVAKGGNGGSGGAGGAGGEGGQGGKNVAEDNGKSSCCKGANTKLDQDANGGYANGGHGGNANGGNAKA